ncbi:MAG TPA: MFS transporter [Thermomicrobiales bacterium]|nr:MFS transporter [Thermomicrobiales bacterium]
MQRLSSGLTQRTALTFVILLGVVSLFGDIVYEGARSITGPYLGVLGASATVVGITAGLGELVGYGLRLVSGYVSDRTQQYWPITLLGYGLTVVAVPLLALVGRWELAAALIIVERLGKAIRTPARDAMLSHATARMGHGWGFGVHEALDQVGATTGALFVAAALAARDSYETGFAVLALPGVLVLTTLIAARLLYPRPQDLERATPPLTTGGFPRVYWLYMAAVAVVAAGYADFPLIAYYFQQERVLSSSVIPLYFAVAMAADALAALVFGRLFDRIGLRVLMVVSLLAAFFAPLVFLGGASLALLGVALWGIGLGAQESIMRAAIAPMVSTQRRGTAYGVFNTGYGLFWFLGSALMGILYDLSLPALIVFSTGMQLASIPLLLWVGRAEPERPAATG